MDIKAHKFIYCLDKNQWMIGCFGMNLTMTFRRQRNGFCLTLYIEKGAFKDNEFRTLMDEAQIIIHGHNAPAHFERGNRLKIQNERITVISAQKMEMDYLPFPFSTDCIVYPTKLIAKDAKDHDTFSAKSETHCKLEYMRRKELKVCNHNYIWSEKPFLKNTTLGELLATHINCTVRVDQKFLESVCKKDCHESFYITKKYEVSWNVLKLTKDYERLKIQFNKIPESFIHITYVPSLNMVTFLSALGGNIVLWLGWCVNDLSNILCDTTSLIARVLILKLGQYNFVKILKSLRIKSLLKFICISLMFYQVFKLTHNYIYSNEMTKITTRNHGNFPQLVLSIITFTFINCPPNGSDCILGALKSIEAQIFIKSSVKLKNGKVVRLNKPTPIISIYGNQYFSLNEIYTLEYSYILFDGKQIEMIGNLYNNIEEIKIELKSDNLSNLHDQFSFTALVLTNSFFNCKPWHRNANRICSINSIVHLKTGKTNVILVETTIMKRLHLDNGVKCDNRHQGMIGENKNDEEIIKCIEKQSNDIFNCFAYS